MKQNHSKGELAYVIGVLNYCAEALWGLGQHKIAREISKAAHHLAPPLSRPDPAHPEDQPDHKNNRKFH